MDEQRITDNNVSEQKQSPRAPVPLQSVPEKKERSGTLYFLWEVIKFALISLIIVAPIRLFIASPFKGKKAKGFMTKLFMTHPSVDERVEALRGMNI